MNSIELRQREIELGRRDHVSLRIHRAISWLSRAEKESDDPDVAFILLWIAFNACYAEDDCQNKAERARLDAFFEKMLRLDDSHEIYNAIWQKFSGPIRVLLENQYVFQPYWNHLNALPGYDNWRESFERAKRAAHQALANHQTETVLSIVFDRLYCLRNQLVHGGATWNSSVNREQVRDGHAILSFLVPRFINIMMDHPHEPWGKPFYPVVKE